MTRYDYLIVGGGMTADAAAHGIRKHDAKGSIGIVGSDRHAPYNRPPLTKGLWKGEPPESIERNTEETDAELILGRRIASLDPAAQRATDDRKTDYQYRTLLLATGGRPRRLPNAPDGVVYFRTLNDYRTVRGLSDRGSSFAVIGAGFIGAEITAALRMQDREVTMIVRDQGIGAKVYPADLSHWLVGYYRQKGVTVRLGEEAKQVEARDGRFRLHAGKGDPLAVDAVIAGLGIEPDVGLAQDAGLAVGDGIEVDRQLRRMQPAGYLCRRRRGQLSQSRAGQADPHRRRPVHRAGVRGRAGLVAAGAARARDCRRQRHERGLHGGAAAPSWPACRRRRRRRRDLCSARRAQHRRGRLRRARAWGSDVMRELRPADLRLFFSASK